VTVWPVSTAFLHVLRVAPRPVPGSTCPTVLRRAARPATELRSA
jgi:hypothetical protein